MPDNTSWKQSGTFTLSQGRSLPGELSVDGSKTSLYVRDATPSDNSSYANHFEWQNIPEQCVTGTLQDLTKVSLFDCIVPRTGWAGSGTERYRFADVLPNFVIRGRQHIGPSDETIIQTTIHVDDATTLFYDFDAFAKLIDARPFIEQITKAQSDAIERFPGGRKRKITPGADPVILYFTGKLEIFSSDTDYGRIYATHNPSYNLGGPSGVHLTNKVLVRTDYPKGVTFETATSHSMTILRFLEMVVGRKQELLDFTIRTQTEDKEPTDLQVYWSFPPKRQATHEERNPHPGDLLVDAVEQPQSFASLLANWIGRDIGWRAARQRFSNSFAHGANYAHDRLIGAANMFDILPEDAVPADIPLSPDLAAAKLRCVEIFSKLSVSPERDSVLGALGRIGKSNLKQKIRHRAKFIVDATGDRFPELFKVTDEAVNCRNYYVHGTSSRFDYSENFGIVNFLTDTLEFVFGASDFIEAGWDINAWIKSGTTMSHPFGAYRVKLQRQPARTTGYPRRQWARLRDLNPHAPAPRIFQLNPKPASFSRWENQRDIGWSMTPPV